MPLTFESIRAARRVCRTTRCRQGFRAQAAHRDRVVRPRAGYELVGEFYDAAVSGADPIDAREGFAAILKAIEGNGVRTIIVETASHSA